MNKTEKEIFGRSGSVFFHPFWLKIAKGATLDEAFNFAKEHYRMWKEIDNKSVETIDKQTPKMVVTERSIFQKIGFEIIAFFRSIFGMLVTIAKQARALALLI